jgi:hypothetical protein
MLVQDKEIGINRYNSGVLIAQAKQRIRPTFPVVVRQNLDLYSRKNNIPMSTIISNSLNKFLEEHKWLLDSNTLTHAFELIKKNGYLLALNKDKDKDTNIRIPVNLYAYYVKLAQTLRFVKVYDLISVVVNEYIGQEYQEVSVGALNSTKEKSRMSSIELDENIKKKLSLIAILDDTDMQSLVSDILSNFVKRRICKLKSEICRENSLKNFSR